MPASFIRCLEELKKVADGDAVFKQAGTVLIKSKKQELIDELEERIELTKTRAVVLEKQETRLKETLKEQEAKITEQMKRLPVDKPRYLMGVGRPQDLLEAIGRGIDLFDCVMPTRNGRNAMAFTDEGSIRLRNLKFERDPRPLQEGCTCPACSRSRGYIRHLFMAGEMLGPILLSIHNLTYYQRLLADAREAIAEDRFEPFRRGKIAGWGG